MEKQNNVETAFFFQIQEIPDHRIIFDEFRKQEIFFSYFQVDQNYYLFFYHQKPIEIDFIYESVDVLQKLDSKKRKIRFLRGFFLYALEIMETGEDYEILNTNLQPFFWRKVKNIIRQNKKGALLEFLFGSQDQESSSISISDEFEKKVQNLHNQVNSLQNRIRYLETTLQNSKYALSRTLNAPDATKIIQQKILSSSRIWALISKKMIIKLIRIFSKLKNPGMRSQKVSQRPLKSL